MNKRILIAVAAIASISLSACSTSGNSATTNNPLAGVTIIEPTPTPVPTPTVAPTATPTPAPMATQAIADSGFESGGFAAGWSACSIPHSAPSSTASPFPAVASGAPIGADVVSPSSAPAQVQDTPAPETTPAVYDGTYSALTFTGTAFRKAYPGAGGATSGTKGTNGVCQTFTVPTDAMLSIYVNEGGTETELTYADQEADIVSSTGVATNLFYELNGTTGAPPAETWVKKTFALTAAPYNLTPGSQVTLFAGTFDNGPSGYYGVYMFVDDVTVTGTTFTPSARARIPSAAALPRSMRH